MMSILELTRSTLFWCTIINFGVYLWWFAVFALAHDWMHRFHGRWFNLSVERFDALHYGGMAMYKIAIIVFNLVPWIALHIVGRTVAA